MAGYKDCIARLIQAAGRPLSDAEVSAIFERIHKAALDIKAGRIEGENVKLGGGKLKAVTADIKAAGGEPNILLQEAAQYAAAELEREAALVEKQAALQLVRLGSRQSDVEQVRAGGVSPIEAPGKTLARDYSGQSNVKSLEQQVAGYRAEFVRKLDATWKALGNDFLGFFQDPVKLTGLVRELRGEDSGNPLAKKGAKAFHEVAEEARQVFNANGGDVGRLDDWGMPQHHSQDKVSGAGGFGKSPRQAEAAWIEKVMPLLDRTKYKDEAGMPFTDDRMREFLQHAWLTIATNGHANIEPGKQAGSGKIANRHAESRQIHFKDAESTIAYWREFGERTPVEILLSHIETMARDVAFIEHYGPNPDTTWRTLQADALKRASITDPANTARFEGEQAKLNTLYNYAAGRTLPTYRRWLKNTAQTIANLNVGGKLAGAAVASFYGDKPMMEAVSHMNNLPALQRWRTEMSLLNPANPTDRNLIQTQGLMLDSVRSGLQRFAEDIGSSSLTGRIANAVMRVSGMNAINEIRKGSFGLSLMSSIGNQIQKGAEFNGLPFNDVRALRNYGITKADWDTWKLAKLESIASAPHVLTPEGISQITDDQLKAANVIGQADGPEAAATTRRNAIVKLLGAVNTESEFAIVTPGWRERASFYGKLQRGSVDGEIIRSILQFKAFPWAFLQRGMDAVANQEGPAAKTAMVAYLLTTTTLAGAMLIETRDMLAGKDPRGTMDRNWAKFWGAALINGGALGIYGDFLYGINETRYGSGWAEAMSGPTLGPLLELGIILPTNAIKARAEGKPTHLGAQMVTRAKAFIPGNNLWYTKAATDHLVWQKVMEGLSPGYLENMREKVKKDYNQDWWWKPGTAAPERIPALEKMTAR